MSKWVNPFTTPFEKQVTSGELIPPFVQTCVNFLLREGPGVEGIFRLSASASAVNKLKDNFGSGKKKQFDKSDDVIAVACLFKVYFREQPEALTTWELYDCFIAAHGLPDEQRLESLRTIVGMLSPVRSAMLHMVCTLMNIVSKNSSVNKMSCDNLAICMAPNLLRPKVETMETIVGDAEACQAITKTLFEQVDIVFDTRPQRSKSVDAADSQSTVKRVSSAGAEATAPVPAQPAQKPISKTPSNPSRPMSTEVDSKKAAAAAAVSAVIAGGPKKTSSAPRAPEINVEQTNIGAEVPSPMATQLASFASAAANQRKSLEPYQGKGQGQQRPVSSPPGKLFIDVKTTPAATTPSSSLSPTSPTAPAPRPTSVQDAATFKKQMQARYTHHQEMTLRNWQKKREDAGVKGQVEEFEAEFQEKAVRISLGLTPDEAIVEGSWAQNEMKKIFTGTMRKRAQKNREAIHAALGAQPMGAMLAPRPSSAEEKQTRSGTQAPPPSSPRGPPQQAPPQRPQQQQQSAPPQRQPPSTPQHNQQAHDHDLQQLQETAQQLQQPTQPKPQAQPTQPKPQAQKPAPPQQSAKPEPSKPDAKSKLAGVSGAQLGNIYLQNSKKK